jgi:hypothetical protein
LLPRAASILEAAERLAPRVTPDLLRQVVSLVPDDWLAGDAGEEYVAYLSLRLEGGAFAEEAERARAGA